MALNDIFESVLGFTQNGEKIVNVLHFRQSSVDVTNPAAKDLALAVEEDLWTAAYKAVVCDDLSLQTVRCNRIWPTLGGTYIHNVDDAGSVVDDPLPPNSNALLAFYSATVSKKGRGRIHISGVPDGWHKDGILDTANIAPYTAVIAAILGPFQKAAGATFQCGTWSAGDLAFWEFTSGVVRSHLYTLRSRRMSNP